MIVDNKMLTQKKFTLCFIVTKFCVLDCLIIERIQKNIIYYYSSLTKVFFPPQKFCVMNLNFTGNYFFNFLVLEK